MTGQGSVERLEAPSLDSKTGIRLAGKTYGRITLDGQLHGRHAGNIISPRGNSYRLSLPAPSATLLTVRPGP
jgi:hypothetical protein